SPSLLCVGTRTEYFSTSTTPLFSFQCSPPCNSMIAYTLSSVKEFLLKISKLKIFCRFQSNLVKFAKVLLLHFIYYRYCRYYLSRKRGRANCRATSALKPFTITSPRRPPLSCGPWCDILRRKDLI